jgi:hemerythrin-like domain-containing protein
LNRRKLRLRGHATQSGPRAGGVNRGRFQFRFRNPNPGLNAAPGCAIYKNMETITKALIMEHAVFCAVFDQIERVLAGAPSAPEVKLLASVVEGLLSRHAETETNLAYSVLDHALADRGALRRLHQDHQEIDHQFKRLQRAADAAEAQHRLKRALAATREHFRREEATVFPMLEQTLQPDTLWALGRQWMEQHSVPAAA